VSVPSSDVVPTEQEFASRVWNELSDRVDAFIAAWDKATEPPSLGTFIPGHEPAVRRLVLSELIKVDLEYRWRANRFPKLLEEYLTEFPELTDQGQTPLDLVYEEYHVRRQAGEEVDVKSYYRRFPTQETELRRMLKLDSPHRTTTLLRGPVKVPTELGNQIDDFDLLTELGQGAFATVHLARQRSMQRMVALKISADSGSEPQTLAQLDHPNIVRVYDQRQLPDRKLRLLYMQYVPGGTLESVLRHAQNVVPHERHGSHFVKAVDRALDERGESAPADSSMRDKLSNANWPEVICWLGSRLAAALAYAHHQGVLHRDLKPANVLVAADGNPKLADFNISFSDKVEGATPAAYFGGSLAYMSPEQLEACNPKHEREPDSLDGRTDVYALGVMLWELLTGSRPFPDERPTNDWTGQLVTMVARRTAGIDPQTLASLPVNCPPGLRNVMLKCLAPNVENRFTAAEAARQFDICLQPRAQRLLYPPKTYWRSKIERHPIWTTVICIVTINAIVSYFNIIFNADRLLMHFNMTSEDPVWRLQIAVVNLLAYSIGIWTLLRLALPVLKGAGPTPPSVSREQMAEIRRRASKLGEYFAKVGITLWIATGIVFPVLLSTHSEAPELPSVIRPTILFLLSQVLFGITASTLSYFIMTFLVVRYFYPRLLSRDVAQPQEASQLVTLSQRMSIYSWLAYSVPVGAVLVLMSFTENRTLALRLGAVGFVGSLFTHRLDRIIRDDLAALTQVVNPAGSTLAGTETVSDSFMTGTRR
jgi:eukaryotic-like serine/threonine-protein kinase